MRNKIARGVRGASKTVNGKPPMRNERQATWSCAPWRIGPYFSPGHGGPVLMGEYAASVGQEVPREECAGWTRLGNDNGAELCIDADGVVRTVHLYSDEEDLFVNSSPSAFTSCLTELHSALGIILSTNKPQTASSAYTRLVEQLHTHDQHALADPENWWPLVLNDIRDTAAIEWYAAFEYVNADGSTQVASQAGAITVHPEERLWETLTASGVRPQQVLRIHTDLEACLMPGHYCSMWLAKVFPHAEVTHNFPYGKSADSRVAGIRMLTDMAGR